jgi:hypothetical protein
MNYFNPELKLIKKFFCPFKIRFEPICFQILWQFGMCGGVAPNLFTPIFRAARSAASKLRSSYFKNTPQFRISQVDRGCLTARFAPLG